MTDHALQAARLADRKARLLRDGAACRAGMVQAGATMMVGLRGKNLAREVFDHTVEFAEAGLDSAMTLNSRQWVSLLPLAATAASYLWRKKLIKPALGATVIAAAIVIWVRRRRP